MRRRSVVFDGDDNHYNGSLCAAGDLELAYDRFWDGPAVLWTRQQAKLARGGKDEEHAMSHKLNSAIAVIGMTSNGKSNS
jgi:hypothetical protein